MEKSSFTTCSRAWLYDLKEKQECLPAMKSERLITTILFALTMITTTTVNAVNEPLHKIVLKEGNFELRDYAPSIVAYVTFENLRGKEAFSAAWKPLSGYIFGKNNNDTKIQMTAPVTRQPQKIDMTSPVIRCSDGAGVQEVSFFMPEKWDLDSLPVPDDSRVRLKSVPGRRIATLRYSGYTNDKREAKAESSLREWIQSINLEIDAGPIIAVYNSPFTLGPFRRNELQFVVKGTPSTQ